jgi:hypothetical protein
MLEPVQDIMLPRIKLVARCDRLAFDTVRCVSENALFKRLWAEGDELFSLVVDAATL